jgi:NitT/TauT family transport system permease protein
VPATVTHASSPKRASPQRARWARAASFKSALWFGLPLLVAASIWQALVNMGVLDERLTPAPSHIVQRLVELATADGNYLLWSNLGASAGRVLPALVIAAVIGTLIGVLIGLSQTANDYFSAILGFLLPLPAVAWTPVFVVSVGRGYTTMLIVLVLGAVFPVIYNVMVGVQGIAERQIWALQSMGGSRCDVLTRVVLPAAWPSILNGLRLGMGHAWRTLVAVELLTAATTGLGALIFNSRSSMDTTTMYAAVVTLATVGLLMDNTVFRLWENRTIGRWGES